MTNHTLWVKKWILPQIETGAKSLEVRLPSPTINRIKINDCIVFNGRVPRNVSDIRMHINFEELLLMEDPFRILPGHDLMLLRDRIEEFWPHGSDRNGVIVFEIGPSGR